MKNTRLAPKGMSLHMHTQTHQIDAFASLSCEQAERHAPVSSRAQPQAFQIGEARSILAVHMRAVAACWSDCQKQRRHLGLRTFSSCSGWHAGMTSRTRISHMLCTLLCSLRSRVNSIRGDDDGAGWRHVIPWSAYFFRRFRLAEKARRGLLICFSASSSVNVLYLHT